MKSRSFASKPMVASLVCVALALAAIPAQAVTFTTDTIIAPGNTSYDGQSVVVQGCVVTIDGPHTFASLTVQPYIASPGVVTCSPGSEGLRLTVTGNVTVWGSSGGVASRIDVTGRGFPSQSGPGAGSHGTNYGGGGGYGGNGGPANAATGGTAYGSIIEPIDLGSGGGTSNTASGSGGGGSVKLQVNGTLTIDGSIVADGGGQGSTGGGGSGGSIWLLAGSLAGSGSISADGASPVSVSAGSGGGGRIALYCASTTFTGTASAKGGLNRSGGAGTVYSRLTAAARGTLLIDNGGRLGELTPLASPEAFDVTITGKSQVYAQAPLMLHDLSVSDGVLMHLAGQNSLDVIAQGNVTIASGGTVTAAGKGLTSGQGDGQGLPGTSYGGGAGYGGSGGPSITAAGGTGYGSILQPSSLGSGGGAGGAYAGGPGGGCVRLEVAGTLTVDGALSADGATVTNQGGGGSGGSLWLIVGTLAGSGSISADGASPYSVSAGSGGGGRIAVYYGSNPFSGSITARGGVNKIGGAGTVYMRHSPASTGTLLVDNGGRSGQMTYVTSPEPFDLIVANEAVAIPAGPIVVSDLTVDSGGTVTQDSGLTGIDVTVLGSATITATGEISAIGKGYAGSQGPGAGSPGISYGGGGGYGGFGGTSTSSAGGAPYGSILQPVDPGSGGGAGTNPGGPGGGTVRLQVGGILSLNGIVSADGSAISVQGGGGSGGSIWLSAGTITGSGQITANGASPTSVAAGSGAGGRIAIYYSASTYTGTATAYGGTNRVGAPGTVYTRSNLQQVGNLRIDNGGRTGSQTVLQFASRYNLTLAGGATAYAVEPVTLASLRIESGATLTQDPNEENLDVTVLGDATIAAQGAINVSGKGEASTLGSGAGANGVSYGGGAGYGGAGGSSISSSGGVAYGSRERPVDRGGGGGKGAAYAGGTGGGALRLRVNGSLALDGAIRSDAVQMTNQGGGGSGGSIYLTVGVLSGSGAISALGGSPASTAAGGGGGGRVAIYYGDMTGFLASQVSVTGGAIGARKAADGTIYLGQIEPPDIAEIPDHYAVVGMSYRGPLPEIIGDAAGIQWDVTSGPAAMTIDQATGEVRWESPDSAGSPYTVTIQATNSSGAGSESWKLYVLDHPKLAPDGIELHFGGQVVTAAYEDYFYVENDSRASGMLIALAGHEMAEGQRADIAGMVATNAAGEKFIQAATAERSSPPNDSGTIVPLSMTLRSVGGEDWNYDSISKAGQRGVEGGVGLNNVGILVHTWGWVTEVDSSPSPDWFRIEDGSGRSARCIAPDGTVTIDPAWIGRLAFVNGISSLEEQGGLTVSRILMKRYGDPLLY